MDVKKLAVHILVVLLVAGVAFGAHTSPAASREHSQPGSGLDLVLPAWQQVNSNGCGNSQNIEMSTLAAFNGYLYAGTHNVIDLLPPENDGAQIFRSSDGLTWTAVTQPGFGYTHDIAPPAILDMTVFKGRIYASTGRGDGPGQIWRSVNGTTWAPMVIHGFGNPDNVDVTALVEYNSYLFAGVMNLVGGAQIWLSFSGDNNTWTQATPTALGPAGGSVTGFAVFNGELFAAISSETPVQVWRTSGGAWTSVVNNGFGNTFTTSSGGMAEFGGYLYVGAGNSAVGAQLWRSNNGTSWSQVIDPGFGDVNNEKVEMVYVFQNKLYVSVKNQLTGEEVWRSSDGMLWEQVNLDGFGDSNNIGSNWSNATTDFLGQLYTGTTNILDGGELWRLSQQSVYLPLVLR